ncbi:DUF7255 family protein [Microbacterium foliorum]|uniref:DUF7255 family protein n=1 Tax=Microbacterium foliorum TaxID=104336 RepID=UPI0009C3D2B2|nr:hypothetical protein [Microbacterium foliorum]AQY00240.1 hypothetical protein B2G67_01125 [Microbacterium foliorum]
MPVGEVEAAVAATARADGIALVRMPRVEWLNTHGHFALPPHAVDTQPLLQRVFEELGGDEREQRSKQLRTLPSDLFHVASGTMVEVDEVQHFTSFRALTIRKGLGAASDIGAEYLDLCREWSSAADKYRASKTAKGFPGPFGRARQRAYNDLLRDLVAPAMGYALIRVPAPKLSGREAYSLASAKLQRLRSV